MNNAQYRALIGSDKRVSDKNLRIARGRHHFCWKGLTSVGIIMKIKQHWKFNRGDRVALGLGLAMVLALTGCVGYVDGGYVGGAVVAPEPDVTIFAGGYDRGRDAHWYSHRGHESRRGHR